MERLEIEFVTYTRLGMPSEVRVYNPQENKLDLRTISAYFIGYAKSSKGYKFYCLSHNTRIVESRNAKFLENDLISGSDRFQDIFSEKYHIDAQPSTSSDKLIVIHNVPQVQLGDRQPIIEVPQIANDNPVDQVIQDSPEIVEQPIEQHGPQENIDLTLRRSTRVRKTAIPSDYVVYLQELDYDIGVENDPKTFSQAISCKESNLWYDATNYEMNSMASNAVWNLIELHDGAKAIRCKQVFKTKKDLLGNIERYKARLAAKGFTQKEGIDYKETFSPVSKKNSLYIIMALVAHFDLELQQMDVKKGFYQWTFRGRGLHETTRRIFLQWW